MRARIFRNLALGVSIAAMPIVVSAQQPAAIAPAQPVADGKWEEIDQRLIFLMVRLANVEASLDAVEAAIAKTTGARSSKLGAAKRAEFGNELMDRKAGGPMKWSEFYGRTAEKFFYHPVDGNTTYHTATVLRQNGPAADNKVEGGVPASQGLPVHQRPPQFDYIYRANRDAQAKAEKDAAELKNKAEELMARRTALEAEQSKLWCEVAFRAVARHDLARKPIYRFEPVTDSSDTDGQQRAEALKAASQFMRSALLIVAEAQKDQAKTFANIKTIVADARLKLDDDWVRQTALATDLTDLKTPVGKFVVLAKRLDDVSNNLSDSFEVAIDGDQAQDDQRKETFRALLQESLVNYAQIVLALDEMTVVMASDWKVKPDVAKPLEPIAVSWATTAAPSVTESTPAIAKSVALDKTYIFNGKDLQGWKFVAVPGFKQFPPVTTCWTVDAERQVLVASGAAHSWIETARPFGNFELSLEWRFVPGAKVTPNGSGVVIRSAGIHPGQYDPTGIEIDISESMSGAFICYASPLKNANGVAEEGKIKRLDALVAATLQPVGEWNQMVVTASGDKISVTINGQPVNAGTGARFKAGPICLRSQSTAIEFRSVKAVPK
jgi:hypothetical protein